MPPTEILDLFSTPILVGRLDLDLGAQLDPAHAAPAGTTRSVLAFPTQHPHANPIESEVGKTLIPRALLSTHPGLEGRRPADPAAGTDATQEASAASDVAPPPQRVLIERVPIEDRAPDPPLIAALRALLPPDGPEGSHTAPDLSRRTDPPVLALCQALARAAMAALQKLADPPPRLQPHLEVRLHHLPAGVGLPLTQRVEAHLTGLAWLTAEANPGPLALPRTGGALWLPGQPPPTGLFEIRPAAGDIIFFPGGQPWMIHPGPPALIARCAVRFTPIPDPRPA